MRSRVFQVLLFFTIAAVLLLPLSITGDGTAHGQLQINLIYSFSAITMLLSMASLWLSCANLAHEIETYQIHMVVSKPTPRWLIWLGKWAGVFFLHAAVFIIGAGLIYVFTFYRLRTGNFAAAEMDKLRSEILVGRKQFLPRQPDFSALARQEYQRRLQEKTLAGDQEPEVVLAELRRQIRASSTEVPFGYTRVWHYDGIGLGANVDMLSVRYRVYVGSTARDSQGLTDGQWGVRDPQSADNSIVGMYQRFASGSFQEFGLAASAIDARGQLALAYQNLNQNQSPVVFQTEDGPVLLVRSTGFFANYLRAVLLILLQLGFMTALGCTVGATFSSPVAIFVALSYLVIGMIASATFPQAPTSQAMMNAPWHRTALEVMGYSIGRIIVSVNDFNASGDLVRGYLIDGSRLLSSAARLLLLQCAPLALFGIWALQRRQLGMVVRK